MAQELSQEALLDFLCQAGGRVTNPALVTHFKSFLRDPDASPGEHKRRRELFKGFVNSVAAVRQDPDGTKYVVLKRRYRDLLGEERLLRPRDPSVAAVPAGGAAPCSPRGARRQQSQPQPRRRRDQEREEEPAGAAARVTDAGCNGHPAKDAREAVPGGGGQRVSSHQIAPALAPAVSARAGVRCAAVETQGQCCWECLQNSVEGLPGESHLDALPNSATAKEKSALGLPAQDDRGAPKERLEGVPAEPEQKRTQEPAVTPTPPATVGPALSRVSLPALQPHRPPAGDRLELLAPCTQQYSTQQQQQLRTLEWVARHPQVPEAQDQSPIRAWSVLPDNFLQLSTETNSAPPTGPPLSSHALFPVVPDESSEPGSGSPPLTVFRSIRCQLSLQDLYDFVDQESHGSEESSSAPKESPGGSEDGLQIAVGTPDCGKRRSPAGGISVSPEERSPSKSPQDLRNRGVGHTTEQAPVEANGLAGHPQEPLPWPASKLRRSLRRSSRARRAKLSSSDEEVLDEDLLKRSRRPPRPSSRKSSKAGAMPSPRVDAALIPKLSNGKAVVTEGGWALSSWVLYREGPSALDMHRHEHKSSLVPLEAREHEWIVKLASGSWLQVLTLFWEDPQLALHKDFLTGYTALHWMAKHGNLRALEDLVSGAQKAGIVLDVNVKSGCGYTPLHLAAIHGHQGVIKWLVQRLSSRVNIRDSSGKKPWQYLTSNTSGEIWQLLGAPRGKPIFPVSPIVRSSSPTRKAKIREISRSVTRKTSFAALLRSHQNKRKFANQYEKFPTSREREEYSD
ncbi:PREDICTED: ankyrin repeat domain-containing protein SOWAHB [Chrysochloris asiatica]|uniref:Ankyrin repeat domain-containing protein SOWAHB n=1 Tax=Chrysochloris asiatica TaxID=185453 RepID=A0A9B0TX09_CHRAS|nr:PREDICTED: ankyrin repeat domain-containing protein SOWAHB [Chrysochloris asiatica]